MDWKCRDETLFWPSEPGVLEDVRAARREYASGETLDESDVRARLRLPRRRCPEGS